MEFWEYFKKITTIPRCSGNEDSIRDYIVKVAKSFNFKYKTDKVGNLLVEVPSKIGISQEKKIVLQSHMDMVCEKNENVEHDFSKGPLQLGIVEIDGEKWLTAEGTTLGADNGVGIAYSLTLMRKIAMGELDFSPLSLDLLFTVDEETGLVGAFEIDDDLISGNSLINLDSEEDDTFTIGCAGGVSTSATISIKREKLDLDMPLKLSVFGLLGGHSGVDIHRGRGNAIKIISTILWKVYELFPIYINLISGGNRSNAIPREAHSIFWVSDEDLSQVNNMVERLSIEIKSRFSKIEPNLAIKIEMLGDYSDKNVISVEIVDNLLNILHEMPNGPISMHPSIQGLVNTSTNLASIKTKEDLIVIETSQRSLVENSKVSISKEIEKLFNSAEMDIKVQHFGDYPGWDPDFNSRLLKISKETYKELFNEEVIVQAIHAGLECGILKKKFPDVEMVSVGPSIVGPHSPDERLKIKSVEKIWTFLIKLLKNLD